MRASAELLAIWEIVAAAAAADRDDAILGISGETPRSLSARNAAMLQLRARLFGTSQQLRCNCPECGAVTEFGIDCDTLSRSAAAIRCGERAQRLASGGYRVQFRLPDIGDVREAAASGNPSFADALLRRCITKLARSDGAACEVEELPQGVLLALSERMEELEPGASFSFDLSCPECGHGWIAPMNVGDVLWAELEAQAERLLLDVDMLARSYGWSEEAILALSPTRRAAYLQLVDAGS
jgi:hypothetical protein